MLNPMRTLLAVGVILLGVSLPVHGQASTGATAQPSGSASGTASPSATSLQLLTTIGAAPTGNATGSGSASLSSNSTRTQTGTIILANVTSVNTGINPSTAIPSEFPSNGAFLTGRPDESHLILLAGFAGLAALCL